jgi:glucose/arabinose dehydrogenase
MVAGLVRGVVAYSGAVASSRTFGVDPAGEGGLLGLAAHPDGERLYVYYSSAAHGDNRVVRIDPDGSGEEEIVTGIPHASFHDGGRVTVGPDERLYVSTGDAGVPERAQDPGSPAGAILRVTLDGGVPADNPIDGSPVYATGIRNAQGLAWDADGRLLATEFGPDCDDEVNPNVAGGNHGGPDDCGETRPGANAPLGDRPPPQASWSGAAIPVESAVPEWDGQLLAAALRGERLWRFELDRADGGGARDVRVTGAAESFVGDYGRLRHAEQAPDGSLWVLTSNRDGRGAPAADDDRILRVASPSS